MSGGLPPAYLLVLGERDALAWVLTTERMAFPEVRARDAAALAPGVRLLLYATRGCFHNPSRDRGRVIGRGRVTTAVEGLDPPVVLAGREFTTGCRIALDALAPFGSGVELAPLVPRLATFPAPSTWSASMRRPLVPLVDADAAHLVHLLAPYERSLDLARESYLARATGRRV